MCALALRSGLSLGFPVQSSEYFDPVNNQWTLSGDLTDTKDHFTMTLLPNSDVRTVDIPQSLYASDKHSCST